MTAREKLKAMLDQRKALKDIGDKIASMGPDQFADYVSKTMADAPKKCGYCDQFSGNSVAPAVRPAYCNHPDLKGTRVGDDDDACFRFSITTGSNLTTKRTIDQFVIEDGYSLSEAEIDERLKACDMLFPVHHEGLPADQVTLHVKNIVAEIEGAGGRVFHAHRYEPDGIKKERV